MNTVHLAILLSVNFAAGFHCMSTFKTGVFLSTRLSDIVDIKPANMEELTEVITSAEFHPQHCHTFAYSSSKGSIRLCDMRQAALCDRHSKCEYK